MRVVQRKYAIWMLYGALITFFYAGIAVLTTWDLAPKLATHLDRSTKDTLVHFWNNWWIRYALSHGQNPFQCSMMFYPSGVSLITHNIAWFNVLIAALTERFIGSVAAYNLGILLSLTLCGCAMFALAYYLTHNVYASLLGGLIYQAWPFRISEIGHPNMLATQWIPLFMLLLILVVERGRWRYGILAGAAFALVGYTRYQQMIGAALLGGIYILANSKKLFCKEWWRVCGPLLAMIVTATLALLPLFTLLLAQQRLGDAAELLRAGDDARTQTDVLAYFIPWNRNPLVGDWLQPVYDHLYGEGGGKRDPAYLGLVALSLAAWGVRSRPKGRAVWVVMAVALVALALGPILRVNGQFYPNIPTPYRLLQPLGVFSLMRYPNRYNMFLALPVAALAAYGAAAWLSRCKGWRRCSALGVALAALILVEYLGIPLSLGRVDESSTIYTELRDEPGDFAVLDLPLGGVSAVKTYMFAQVMHGRPIIEGHVSRLPMGTRTFVERHPGLSMLSADPPDDLSLFQVLRQVEVLRRAGIRYVVMHKDLLDAAEEEAYRRALAMHPRYEDEELAVFATDPVAGRDLSLMADLGIGLGPIEVTTSAPQVRPGSALRVDVVWGCLTETDARSRMLLLLVDEEGRTVHSERGPVVWGWPTETWEAGKVLYSSYVMMVPSYLLAATYDVRIVLLSPGGYQVSEPLTVASLQVEDASALQASRIMR